MGPTRLCPKAATSCYLPFIKEYGLQFFCILVNICPLKKIIPILVGVNCSYCVT